VRRYCFVLAGLIAATPHAQVSRMLIGLSNTDRASRKLRREPHTPAYGIAPNRALTLGQTSEELPQSLKDGGAAARRTNFLRSLRRAIEATPQAPCVGCATSAPKFFTKIAKIAYDL
jgi:hypothetical protein